MLIQLVRQEEARVLNYRPIGYPTFYEGLKELCRAALLYCMSTERTERDPCHLHYSQILNLNFVSC